MGINSTVPDKIGIVFPVYYTGMPFLVKEFIEKVNIPKDAYVFTVVTFGGSQGVSISQLEKLLNGKGAKLSASFGVRMPGNYQVMYPPFSEEKQRECFNQEKEKVAQIVKSIENSEIVKSSGTGGGIQKTIGNMLYGGLFKPHEKDKKFWLDEKCNGCGICAKVCPVNNIKMMEGKPQWQHKCEHCLACMQWCPKASIQYKKGTVKRGRYHHPDIELKELLHK